MNLEKILKEKDLSMAWLSRRLGISRSAVCRWVKNKTIPKAKYFPALSKALNMSEDELVGLFKKKGA